ncbi:MAG: hypothetical protein ACLUNO_09920 [Oscillospiraceae bacterium]
MDTGNADAAALLADVDLAGARTQDALGTLTDALADADYLTDADNTLLVTVEVASGARLQKLGRAVYDARAGVCAAAAVFRRRALPAGSGRRADAHGRRRLAGVTRQGGAGRDDRPADAARHGAGAQCPAGAGSARAGRDV